MAIVKIKESELREIIKQEILKEYKSVNLGALEKEIDKSSLYAVLESISEICEDKAEHIRTNWQDEQTAKVWDNASREINSLAWSKIKRLKI